jgi:hypothetical protein
MVLWGYLGIRLGFGLGLELESYGSLRIFRDQVRVSVRVRVRVRELWFFGDI